MKALGISLLFLWEVVIQSAIRELLHYPLRSSGLCLCWRMYVVQAWNDLSDPPISTIILLELWNGWSIINSTSSVEAFKFPLVAFDLNQFA